MSKTLSQKIDTIPPYLLYLGLYLFAISLNFAYLTYFHFWDIPVEGDAVDYHNIAVSALKGTGWQYGWQSHRPPLISVFLFIIYFIFGVNLVIARLAMSLIVALCPVLLFYWFNKSLKQPVYLALLAGIFWGIYPPAIFYIPLLLTENFASILVLALLIAFLAFTNRPHWLNTVIFGVLCGCLTLTRPVYAFLPFYLFACQYFLDKKTRNKVWLKHWGMTILCFCLVMTPWTVRNYLIHQKFMPLTSLGTTVLFRTNNDLSHPSIQAGGYHRESGTEFLKKLEGVKESERGSIQTTEALKRIRAKIEFLPNAVLHRALNFWSFRPDPFAPQWTRNDLIMGIVFLPILLLFAGSFFLLPFQKYWPLYAVILYAFVFVLPFWGALRFRFPVDPLIVTIALLTLNQIRIKWFGQKTLSVK